ncbi:MAG TPA: dihydrofolate reductase family protein [Candidatus Saccharimonadales bacterium]|nr:dihydrofolate reductase family protein [Candidatus Saccharimonadales bacterium]
MNRVTCGMAMSIDGFVAGPNQNFEHPFGEIPENLLHTWMFDEGDKHKEELDHLLDAGAFIMGSNMFGPKEKRDDPEWKGWWGDNPPYHGPVFVLSEKARDPIEMEGGTTFYFVTDGIEAALKQAKEAAGDRNVAIAGGANTVNQYLAAGLIDELWLHVVPVTVGSGARLFEGVPGLKFEVESVGGTSIVSHLHYKVVK